MCMKTGKPMFLAGGSMMSYYFLSATDLDNAIDIINKNPKKKITEVMSTTPQGLYSMLIDPVTGDLYEYSHSKKQWQPKINSGLHYKQMNETDPAFKHMNLLPMYQAKPVPEDYPLIKGVNVEAIIQCDQVA